MNKMLALAKQRTRRGSRGGWNKRSAPLVYDNAKKKYQLECLREVRAQGLKPPKDPWSYWAIESACFRLHTLRDPTELAAGLKWVCDFFVQQGYVADDSPRQLHIPKKWPSQVIMRRSRGLDITIKQMRRAPDAVAAEYSP
jgi:hypothetical protein